MVDVGSVIKIIDAGDQGKYYSNGDVGTVYRVTNGGMWVDFSSTPRQSHYSHGRWFVYDDGNCGVIYGVVGDTKVSRVDSDLIMASLNEDMGSNDAISPISEMVERGVNNDSAYALARAIIDHVNTRIKNAEADRNE